MTMIRQKDDPEAPNARELPTNKYEQNNQAQQPFEIKFKMNAKRRIRRVTSSYYHHLKEKNKIFNFYMTII